MGVAIEATVVEGDDTTLSPQPMARPPISARRRRDLALPTIASVPGRLYALLATAVKGSPERHRQEGSIERPHTQFSPLPGVKEEGERKEEKDEKPHALIEYLTCAHAAGCQPFTIPTIPSENRRFSYVFPTLLHDNKKETRSLLFLASAAASKTCRPLFLPRLN